MSAKRNVILGSGDFARMMNWGKSKSGVQKASRWLLRMGVGWQQGKGSKVKWTVAGLRSNAPDIYRELLARDAIEV